MPFDRIKLLVLTLALLVLSGVGDAQGFAHAAGVWQNGRLVWRELFKSAAGFTFGISIYWVSIRYLQQLGVESAELQTISWFLITLLGVAVISGQIFKWALLDQVVALLVIAGIGWLLFRTGG